MGFISDVLEKPQGRRGSIQPYSIFSRGSEDNLFFLCQRSHGKPFQPKLFQSLLQNQALFAPAFCSLDAIDMCYPVAIYCPRKSADDF